LAAALGKAGARSVQRSTPQGWKATKGIEGADFFAAGIRRIAQDMPKLIKELTDDMKARADKTVKNRTITVEVGRASGPIGSIMNVSGR
jgi:hypothetical protein